MPPIAQGVGVWHQQHFSAFKGWVAQESQVPISPGALADLHGWLQGNSHLVQLQATFVAEHAKEVFHLLDVLQVAVV